jgi:ubiquinone/menaquinone biosynthesis C-methylase UbiE
MSKISDQNYLKTEQYKDDSRLNARIEIHRRFSTNPQGWNAWVFDTLETLPGQARVLELGCGPAYLWAANAGRIPPGWDITLSDFSIGMLAAAQHSVARNKRPFKFEVIDAQSIPYDDASFALVIANHMLYHIPDRPKALAEIRRVIRPGGRLVATTVGDGHMEELNVWLRRVTKDPDFALFPLPFTLESGRAQLQPYFRQVEIRRYADNLQITEIEPLIAYICSTAGGRRFSESALAELRSNLEGELQSNGALFVTKDSGLFEAVK